MAQSLRLSIVSIVVTLFLSTTGFAQREISADAYRDRLGGMWLGQLLGNYAGRQVEGKTTVTYEGANPVSKSITDYQVQWNTILQGQYYSDKGLLQGNTSQWVGDDDTCLEFLYAYSLQNQASLNVAERTSVWKNNLALSGLYIANRQSWYQINTHNQDAVASGSLQRNMYAGWAIDSQITTESLGAISVGMRQQASNLADDFGGITNSGYSLHAAQFYAAMYADAPFTSDVETLVSRGLDVVPTGSWTRDIITQAQQLYAADKADDGVLNNWLASRNGIIAFAGQQGRYQSWVESSSNTGLTTLAILYGQGNFKDTVEYGVRGGMDSDCNPATSAGLVGMMKGQDAVLAELTAAGYTTTTLPQQYHSSSTVKNLPQSLWSMDEVMDIMQAAAETQLLAGGGSILDPGGSKQYVISAADTGLDAVVTLDVSDPTGGPRGLVGQVLAQGGTVDVIVTRNSVVIADNPTKDRTNQVRLIDGVIDLSNNGVLPFDTYISTMTDPRTDGYELHFDREVLFQELILHEGDIRAKVNTDPGATEPYGGYFLDDTLVVEVLRDGVWVEVTNLVYSEALDDLKFFQSIGLTFDGIQGEAIRVVGSAGGTIPYTCFTEIEVFGVVPEPATLLLLIAGGTGTLLRRRYMGHR